MTARELRSFRVFMGPFDSDEALASTKTRLESLGLDFYVHQDTEGSVVSLKVFSTAEPAAQYVAKLSAAGIDAKSRPEIRTLGPLRWLEVDSVENVNAREKLTTMDWGDAMAKLYEIPCVVRTG